MVKSPAFSVVIPAYNAASYLRRSIDSALAQTFSPLEIVVVDDGSTDDTAALVKSYDAPIRYVYRENGGEPAARNTGIRECRGDWVAFLDADDEWLPHHLDNAARVLQTHPELRWYGASTNEYLQATGQLITEYKKREPDQLIDNAYFEDYMSAVPPYAHFAAPTMVIHKDVFQSVGFFNESLKVGCDIDMWFRIGLLFPEVGYCHTPAANVYKRDSSLSYTTNRSFETVIERIKEREALAEHLGSEVRKRVEPRVMLWVVRLLRTRISQGDIAAVREIHATYKHRLPPKWRWLTRLYLVAPRVVGAFLAVRRRISAKERAFQLGGLSQNQGITT